LGLYDKLKRNRIAASRTSSCKSYAAQLSCIITFDIAAASLVAVAAAAQVRRGPRGGHIPGAVSLPRPALLDKATDWLKPLQQQQQALEAAGITLPSSSSSSSGEVEQKVVIYCNGGVAACTAALSLHRLGHRSWSVYDGSWNEYAASELPVATQQATDLVN
jgi:thiosulfate/3-mercaptopyruvate sulfurtransferase